MLIKEEDGTLFLSQHHFARNMLEKMKLQNLKPIRTPLELGCNFFDQANAFDDPTKFRQIVGLL